MKMDKRNLIMMLAYCLVLCLVLVPSAALAQSYTLTPGGTSAQPDTWVTYSPGRTWAVTDIRILVR